MGVESIDEGNFFNNLYRPLSGSLAPVWGLSPLLLLVVGVTVVVYNIILMQWQYNGYSYDILVLHTVVMTVSHGQLQYIH